MWYRAFRLENGTECIAWDTLLVTFRAAGAVPGGHRLLTFLALAEERWLVPAPDDWASLGDEELRALWLRATRRVPR